MLCELYTTITILQNLWLYIYHYQWDIDSTFYVFNDVSVLFVVAQSLKSCQNLDSLQPYVLQPTRLPCPPLSPRVCSKSYPLNQRCCLTISSLLPPSLPALNLSQHKGLFQWVSSSQQVAKASASVLPMNMQDWFPLGLPGLISCSPRDSQESSPTPQFKSISSSVLSLLYGPMLTTVHDCWKNHSFDYLYFCWKSYVDVSAF